MDISTIKSYLISLGFEADDNMYRKFSAALAKASNEVDKHTRIMSNSYIKASGIVVGSIGTIVTSTTMLLDSLAKADLGYEKYAMRMYMARDAAKQFKIVTDAMGESLEDISWIPELNEKYKALMAEVHKMELPKEYQQEMKMIRDIGFEFTRLKIESIYGLQWIGHNLIKNLIQPLTGVKGSFKDLNDFIVEKMPEWSDKIATTFGNMLSILKDNSDVVVGLTSNLKDMWKNATPEQKGIALLGAGAAMAKKFPVASGILGYLGLTSEIEQSLEGKKTTVPTPIIHGIIGLSDTLFRARDIEKKLIKSIKTSVDIRNLNPWGNTWTSNMENIWGEKYTSIYEELDQTFPNWELSGEEREKASEKIEQQVKDINQIIAKASKRFNVEIPLINAMIKQESGFKYNAISPVGAMGLMQLMPSTASEMGIKNPMDIEENIMGGVGYLRKKLDENNQNIPLALAAYNAGQGRINQYGGIPPFKETQNYVKSIMEDYTGQTINIENVNLNNYKPEDAKRAANDFTTAVTIRYAGPMSR